jgi:hypothetical protein
MSFTEDEFYKRISPMADRIGSSMPRGNTSKRKKPATDKHSRWRQKMVSEGRCPHCGKPCEPFYECEQRRANKKINRILKEAVAQGKIKIVGKDVVKYIYRKNG